MYLDVYIEDSFLGNQALTYDAHDFFVQPGTRVRITIRNRDIIGFVHRVYPREDKGFKVLPIQGVIDEAPILNEELFALAEWMRYRTVSPIIRCLQTILPNKLKPQSSAKAAKMERIVRRTDVDTVALTTRQQAFVDLFVIDQEMGVKEAQSIYSGFRTLVSKGYFELDDREVRYEEGVVEKSYHPLPLTADQQHVVDGVALNRAETYLLHGVTGSGKTEVYLQIAAKVRQQDQQVLILVPEISLTPQMIDRVSKRFGEDVAIYHSALNDQEKYEQYLRVKNHQVHIVVGTRSSVFMPFDNLGLIVVDEEHDSSYKQENVPYYHTRDIAIHRSETHQCPVILGSASPALETYARALRGVYTLLELESRINHNFPKVTVIDTQKALKSRQSAYLTEPLLAGIQARLDVNQQVVLLLNRRGYMTMLKTEDDEVLQCPNCDVALNYHKDDNSIRCHMCGYQIFGAPTINGKRVKLVGSGVGTQRLEEQIIALFPNARVGRMDADTTRKKNAHQQIIGDFIDHKFDILIGTQMIAKGLDIENVTLVGIVNADTSLAYTDYHAVETTFSMLLQAAGRSGRGRFEGEVMIQTANPDHYAIQCAIHQKYKHFFSQEMVYRKTASYPPYNYLISIILSDEDETKSFQAGQMYLDLIKDSGLQIIGPIMLRKMQRKHRCRIIIKGRDLEAMIALCHQSLDVFRTLNRTGVVVDVNPLTLE
ncbi:primosomal protein N' [Erysipelothrix sp. HDW6C]|uniref:replication restart helicase PriA n=1 Tax=Erysipelothrix sp. HDW6C TaxID=2714930 RepID=UPI00140A7942|nr:primosomal protein N' [Erysipelothrix sp. HDW6C]QIK70231.1 primosomal protein N' [Erysipelothrix sp. HDW6C]